MVWLLLCLKSLRLMSSKMIKREYGRAYGMHTSIKFYFIDWPTLLVSISNLTNSLSESQHLDMKLWLIFLRSWTIQVLVIWGNSIVAARLSWAAVQTSTITTLGISHQILAYMKSTTITLWRYIWKIHEVHLFGLQLCTCYSALWLYQGAMLSFWLLLVLQMPESCPARIWHICLMHCSCRDSTDPFFWPLFVGW